MNVLNTPLDLLPDLTPAHRAARPRTLDLYLQHAREYAADPDSTGDIEHWAAERDRSEAILDRRAAEAGARARHERRRAERDHLARPVPTGDIGPWAPERDYTAELDRWAHESRAEHVGHGDALIAAANREAEAVYLATFSAERV